MIKSIKHEFIRRKRFLIGYAIFVAVMEAIIISSLFILDGRLQTNSVILSVLLFLSVFGFNALSMVIDYYSDLNLNQRTLVYSTPRSPFRILGAKYLYWLLELISLLAIVILMMALTNYICTSSGIGNIFEKLIEGIKWLQLKMPPEFGQINLFNVIGLFLFAIFAQYTYSISTANFAITLSSTVFSSKKYNWLLSIVMYFVLDLVLKLIIISPFLILAKYKETIAIHEGQYLLAFTLVMYFGFAICEYIASSSLIKKKLDL